MTADEQAIADACEALIDVATVNHHDRSTEETFTECRICGEWDSHKDGCPIPLVSKWLEAK